jgi:hypothetical protein
MYLLKEAIDFVTITTFCLLIIRDMETVKAQELPSWRLQIKNAPAKGGGASSIL